MKILGIEGKGLLISVGFTIIMCGIVNYYCHMRVKNVEGSIIKQNQVLTSFITNVQNEIRKGGLIDDRIDVSSPEARNAVKNLENSKIEVSDDDSEYETEDDDSDSETEDDISEDDDENKEREIDLDDNENNFKVMNSTINDIKIVDILSGPLNEFTNNSKITELTDLEEITNFGNLRDKPDDDDDSNDDELDDDDSNDDELDDDDSNHDDSNDEIISGSQGIISISKEELDKINPSEIIVEDKQEHLVNVEEIVVEVSLDSPVEIDDESNDFIKKIVKNEDKVKTTNINKMKIDELREKVILTGLGTIESVKKLKKSDLIKLLTEK